MKNKLIKIGLMYMTLGSMGVYAMPSLYLNFTESNKHVDSKVMNYYKVRGFAGDVIESKISSLSADADLYVKIGDKPTRSSKDCRSTKGSTAIDSCSVTLSEDADVYVGVFGYKEADYAVQVTLKDTKVKTINYNQDVFGITPRLKHRDYKIHANAGDVLKIRAYDMDADGDIYVNLGSKARRGVSYVDASRQYGSVDEEVTIEIDNETDVYIGIYADKSCIHTVEHHIKVTRTNVVEEVAVLNSGEADSGSVALKKWKYFKIHASAGDTVKSVLNGLDADADLYVKVGDKPTKSIFDCRSTIGQTAVDSCDVTLNKDADVYIGVFGYRAADFTIRTTYGVVNQSNILFKSGFEDGVYIDPVLVEYSEDYDFIRGVDNQTGFSWPIDILGASESALHRVSDDDNTALKSEIQTVEGYNGEPTKAMYNEETHRKNGDTQLTYEILNITEGKSDLYVRYRMKIDSNMLGTINKWRALFEYKTKDYKDPDEGGTGFRLISFIYTDNQGKASWHFQGDKDSSNPIWECDTLTLTPECNNEFVPVITDEWFLTEYYWHWSNDNDGYVVWKINGKIVGEHHGPTTRNNNAIDFILLTQLYGNVTPKHQWIDDLEIWDGLPNK